MVKTTNLSVIQKTREQKKSHVAARIFSCFDSIFFISVLYDRHSATRLAEAT